MPTSFTPVRRRRAQTAGLITHGPLSSIAEYTPKRLEERANFAEARLKSTTRVPTPNVAKMLTLYKNACMDLHLDYDNFSQDETLQRAEEIRGYDEDLSSKDWLREDPDSSMLDNVLKLRKYAYWARYGDYAVHMESKAAEASETAFADEISGQFLWTEISKNIHREERIFKEQHFHDTTLVPTTVAVYEACGRIGIDCDVMIKIIHLYADRNAAFHLCLKVMLEDQAFGTIARCIVDDLSDLASVYPPELSGQEGAMRALLEELRDEWFDTSFNPNKPGAWRPKLTIQKAYYVVQETKQIDQQDAQSIAQRAINRLHAIDEEVESDGKPTEGETIRPIDVSDRKEAWKTIMRQQYRAHGDVLSAVASQRKVNRVISTYR